MHQKAEKEDMRISENSRLSFDMIGADWETEGELSPYAVKR